MTFSKRVDLEGYIRQFAKEKAMETVTKVVDGTKEVAEGIKNIGNKIVDGIGKILG